MLAASVDFKQRCVYLSSVTNIPPAGSIDCVLMSVMKKCFVIAWDAGCVRTRQLCVDVALLHDSRCSDLGCNCECALDDRRYTLRVPGEYTTITMID